MAIIPLIFLFSTPILCYSLNLSQLFRNINEETTKFNHIATEIAWELSINPGNTDLVTKSTNYQRERLSWQQKTCNRLAALANDQLLNDTQSRQTYLLCRGPRYTFEETRESSLLFEELQRIYSEAKICIPYTDLLTNSTVNQTESAISIFLSSNDWAKFKQYKYLNLALKVRESPSKHNLCLHGENEIQNLMRFSRNEEVLIFLWMSWRDVVGPPMKEPYKQLVMIENKAAQRNGYLDIGSSWREELETPNLRQLCLRLYNDIQPLYKLLHGVVRFYLGQFYGDVVPKYGPIPAYLLGDLWSQNWESLTYLMVQTNLNLDESINKQNWTVTYMIKRAEDFYRSFGLPPLTQNFWRNSVFTRESNDARRCHGAAADMFKDGDYRLLYCSGTSFEDFYVMHHELGHIQYYMAYENQPGIFRSGANTAFHETIGDTIMLGVYTPQHLHRLGLINDTELYTQPKFKNKSTVLEQLENEHATKINYKYLNNRDEYLENLEITTDLRMTLYPEEVLMLKVALNKLPQIPFSLLIDEYRWRYFEGSLKSESINKEFWELARVLQGIAPPGERSEVYFDFGAKFHVPDNTPYIRYFLSSFLQHQLFETLCKTAVFGRRHVKESLPSTISMNRCDIYGSKAVGKLLKQLMSQGSSKHWKEILRTATGQDDITAAPLLRYYRPLEKILTRLVKKHRIPIGW